MYFPFCVQEKFLGVEYFTVASSACFLLVHVFSCCVFVFVST